MHNEGCLCRQNLRWILALAGALWFILVVIAFLPFFHCYPKSNYSAEAVPVIGNLRTKIELFRNEKGRLPGLGCVANATSQLREGVSRVQTFLNGTNAAFTADFRNVVSVTNRHTVWSDMDAGVDDLTGRSLRPQHIQYRVDGCDGKKRVFAVGAFGDNYGLLEGTGYAVLEFSDPERNIKALAVWERYELFMCATNQVIMVNAAEARRYFNCETPEQAAALNICWAGDTDALMCGNRKQAEQALDELRKAGWEVDGRGGYRGERRKVFLKSTLVFIIFPIIVFIVGVCEARRVYRAQNRELRLFMVASSGVSFTWGVVWRAFILALPVILLFGLSSVK